MTSDDDSQLAELLSQLAERVEDLAERVEDLEQVEHNPWPAATESLKHWVDTFLNPTFYMEALLKDWWTNNAVMSELQALYEAYLEMKAPNATGWDKTSWHRIRAETEERIRVHIKRNSGAAGWGDH